MLLHVASVSSHANCGPHLECFYTIVLWMEVLGMSQFSLALGSGFSTQWHYINNSITSQRFMFFWVSWGAPALQLLKVAERIVQEQHSAPEQSFPPCQHALVWLVTGEMPRPEGSGEGQGTLVKDYTVRSCVIEALRDGVPKCTVKKWVQDLSKDFFVQDDMSFINAWRDLRHRWERLSSKRQRRQKRKRDEPEDVSVPAPQPGIRLTNPQLEAVLEAVKTAHADIAEGVCNSMEKALAVHLSLGLSSLAAPVLSALSPSATGPQGKQEQKVRIPKTPGGLRAMLADFRGQQMGLKQLALLVHPDKSRHPRAKDAFQKLAPFLRLDS
ncbi:unnamed protein product [Symbiodinium natans]|uniref:J domain-containing protein n=1 Tax=Symbiodinium natans TaxID=878477 RepID=A0A812MLD6_9DINO|nr:unnamed protein product [Symbiodinium natans]